MARRSALLLLAVVACELLLTTAYRAQPPRYVRLDEGFRPNKEYTYDYETTTFISLEGEDDADQQSVIRLKTSAKLTLLNNDIAILRFSEPMSFEKTDLSSTDSERTKWSPVDDKDELQLREQLVKPVAFRFEDHTTISQVKVDQSDPVWSINIKKACMQLFQLDLTGRRPVPEQKNEPSEKRQQKTSSTRNVYSVVEESAYGTCNTLYVVRDDKEDIYRRQSQLSPSETTDLPLFEVKKSRNSTSCIDMPRFNESNITPTEGSNMEPARHTNVVEYTMAGSRRDYVIVSAELRSQIVVSLPIPSKPMSLPKPTNDVVIESWSRLRLVKVDRADETNKRPSGPSDSKTLRSPLRLETPLLDDMFPERRPEDSQESSSWKQSEESREGKWRMEKFKDIATKFCERKSELQHSKAAALILEAIRTVRMNRPEQFRQLISEMPCVELRMPLVEAYVIENKPRTVEVVIELIRQGKMTVDEVKTIFNYISLSSTPKSEEISTLKTLCDEFETKQMRLRRSESSDDSSEVLPEEQKWSLKKRCYLTYSNMIGSVCAQKSIRPEWSELRKARCTEERFADELRQLMRSSKTPREEYLALAAVSNAGLPQLFPEISAIIRDRSNLRHPEPIYALRLVASLPEMRHRVRDLLMPVYADTRLPEDVRIAAYIVIMMTHPTYPVMSIIAESLSKEPSSHVTSFVYSHLNTIAKSTQDSSRPTSDTRFHAKVASIVKHLTYRPDQPDQPEQANGFSKYLKYGLHSDKLNSGISADVSVSSRRNIGPNRVFGNLHVNIFGRKFTPLEVAASVFPLHEHDFANNKKSLKNEVNEETEEEIVRRLLKSVGVERFFESLGRQEEEKSRPIDSTETNSAPIKGYGAYYNVKVFGKVLNFEHVEVSELKSIVNKLLLRLIKQESSQPSDKTYANLLTKTKGILPTDSGIYVNFWASLASVITVKRSRDVSMNLNMSPKSIGASLHPIIGLAGEMRVNIRLPYLRQGLATSAKLRLEVPLKVKVAMDEEKKSPKIVFEPHTQKYDIVKASVSTTLFDEPLLREDRSKPTEQYEDREKVEQTKVDFEPERPRFVNYRLEKPICSSPSRCNVRKMTNDISLPIVGDKMSLEVVFNPRSPLSSPMRLRLTSDPKSASPIEIKLSTKEIEKVNAEDIIAHMEKVTGVKIDESNELPVVPSTRRHEEREKNRDLEPEEEKKQHMRDDREDAYRFVREGTHWAEKKARKEREQQSDKERRDPKDWTSMFPDSAKWLSGSDSMEEREDYAKSNKGVPMYELRQRLFNSKQDKNARLREVSVELKSGEQKMNVVFSVVTSSKASRLFAYVSVPSSSTTQNKIMWESILPLEKTFGSFMKRSLTPEDLEYIKEMRSHHVLRYGPKLDRRVIIDVKASDKEYENEQDKYENDKSGDMWDRVEERPMPSENKREITSKRISTYKAALESVPEMITSFKRCITERKYGYDKCPETRADYIYTCLSRHVPDDKETEWSAETKKTVSEKEQEMTRHETIVKVDRCITKSFVNNMYLRDLSLFVRYDTLPERATEVLSQVLNFVNGYHGQFEPASYRPGKVLVKFHWSYDMKDVDLSVYGPKFSFKSYGNRASIMPPNRIYGSSPLTSLIRNALMNDVLSNKHSTVFMPTCKLETPLSVIKGKEPNMRHVSVRSFDGSKYEVPISQSRPTILAASCTSKPSRTLYNEPTPSSSLTNQPITPIYVAVEPSNEDSKSRQISIRVDDRIYRVTKDCRVSISNTMEGESIRRRIVPTERDEWSPVDETSPLFIRRYDDKECYVEERTSGISIMFDGYNVRVQPSPLRTGFATPLCGLCGELTADNKQPGEFENPSLRRQRVENVVIRNTPSSNKDVEERDSQDDEEMPMEYTSEQQRELNECELIYKTAVDYKTDSGRICFSRQTVPSCPSKCRPTQTRSEPVEMTCLPDSEETRDMARRMMISPKGLMFGTLRIKSHPAHVSDMRNVPVSCERNI